jgi:hypothetical protein
MLFIGCLVRIDREIEMGERSKCSVTYARTGWMVTGPKFRWFPEPRPAEGRPVRQASSVAAENMLLYLYIYI